MPKDIIDAIARNEIKTIQAFIKQDPKNINASDERGRTLLIIAARLGNQTIVEELLKLGAAPELTDLTGDSSLHHAAFQGKINIIKLIVPQWISRSDIIFAKDKNGNTPRDFAQQRGNKENEQNHEDNKTCHESKN